MIEILLNGFHATIPAVTDMGRVAIDRGRENIEASETALKQLLEAASPRATCRSSTLTAIGDQSELTARS